MMFVVCIHFISNYYDIMYMYTYISQEYHNIHIYYNNIHICVYIMYMYTYIYTQTYIHIYTHTSYLYTTHTHTYIYTYMHSLLLVLFLSGTLTNTVAMSKFISFLQFCESSKCIGLVIKLLWHFVKYILSIYILSIYF